MLDALAESDDRPVVHKLAVREMPTSGKPDELLHAAGIDTEAIVEAARRAGIPADVVTEVSELRPEQFA